VAASILSSLEDLPAAAPDSSSAMWPNTSPDPTATSSRVPVASEANAKPSTPAIATDEQDTQANKPTTTIPRRAIFAGATAAALATLIALGTLWSHRQEDRVALTAHVTLADERIAAGRLAGPSGDEALDHLIAARALRADDPRVMERLSALASKFEQLGDKALERGDVAEAAAHYQGAVLAEPGRAKASQRLKDIELRIRSGKPTE
jgi:hypothetical protein